MQPPARWRSPLPARGGPGEFRYIDFLGWSGDALWATDFLLKRYSTFTATGEHLETRSTGRWVAEARGGVPIALTANGQVVLQPMLTSKMLADGTVTTSPWYLGDPVDETVRPFAMRQLKGTTTLAPFGEWGVYFSQPLAERSLIALHPGGDFIVVVQQPAGSDPPGQVTITRYDPGGHEVGRRAYDYRAFPVSARAADSLVRARAADFEHGMSPAQAYDLARREVRVPTHYPPVAAVTVARDSSVWLQLSDVDPSTRKWLVLDGRGEIRAQVTGPTSFSVRVPGAETVWGLMLGNYDVPYVARFGVTR